MNECHKTTDSINHHGVTGTLLLHFIDMKENHVMGGGIPLFPQSMVIYKQESRLVCAAFVLILHVFALVFTHTPFLQHPSNSKSIKKL